MADLRSAMIRRAMLARMRRRRGVVEPMGSKDLSHPAVHVVINNHPYASGAADRRHGRGISPSPS